MSLTLYTYPENPRAYKALVAAKYAGVEIEVPPFEFGVDNKTQDFLEMNPLGKVPTLLAPEGPIFESNAIARYVARLSKNALLGSNAYECALVDQWIDFATNEIEYASITWLGPILGFLPYQKPAVEKAKTTVFASLKVLNDYLEYNTFMVGNVVTLADIDVFCTLMGLFKHVLDASERAKYPHVTRWFLTCLNQPEFESVVGSLELCEVVAEPQPPKKDKKEKKEKEEKPAAEEKPAKKEKGGKKKKDADDEGESSDAPVNELEAAALAEQSEKKKNPVDDLPPSAMNLNDWKVLYSNTNETRAVCMPWLWEHVDDGWSFWYCVYKYNHELEHPKFMTSNLVSGYHSRAEACRKYAFCSMLICGTNEKQSIYGVWMTRGQDFLNVLETVDDTELYDWRKLDVSKEEDRAVVADMFCWDKPVEGLEVLDGKVFK